MLEVLQLSKTFALPKRKKRVEELADPREEGKRFHAVRNVSFTCNQGEILGLLGANGAGKTTVLRMLATAIQPTSGTAIMNGVDIVANPLAAKSQIGFLSGSTGLYHRLTPREIVSYFGQLHQVPKTLLNDRIRELFKRLEIEPFADRRVDQLSTGMKQRVSIARTMIHDPQVLFFDEPTSGLDVLSSESIVAFIAESRDAGKTLILSTHFMHEVHSLCNRVVLIHEGKICFEGKPSEMVENSKQADMEQAFKWFVRGGSR